MGVVQQNKWTVCSLMDYRELNLHVGAYTADADVCDRKTKRMEMQRIEHPLLDLISAYLQVCIDERLWSYQTKLLSSEVEGTAWPD